VINRKLFQKKFDQKPLAAVAAQRLRMKNWKKHCFLLLLSVVTGSYLGKNSRIVFEGGHRFHI